MLDTTIDMTGDTVESLRKALALAVEDLVEMRARVTTLEMILVQGAKAHERRLKLSEAEGRILAALLNAGSVPKEELIRLLTSDLPVEARRPNHLNVVMHHLRRKLNRRGIAINTVWNYGYAIDVERTRAILDGKL